MFPAFGVFPNATLIAWNGRVMDSASPISCDVSDSNYSRSILAEGH